MSTEKTDFLRFSAYSIKDLITRKLSEDSKFTDQIYEGSNLNILIDLVSYMYQCLVYQLNNAAAESMFSDTLIYENINRLVRMIGYTPRGVTPSKIDIYISAKEEGILNGVQIPKYSLINTGMVDENGKDICFSTVKKGSNNTETINNESYHRITLYNGVWKLYSTIFTASGNDYETFVLGGIKSDEDNKQYVAGDFIDVYVEDANGEIEPWFFDKYDIFLVSNNTNYENNSSEINPQFYKLYNGDDKIYHIILNEEHTYEISFGNGVSGKKPSKGDKIYIFYLDTNGEGGNIDASDIDTNIKFECGPLNFGISKNLFKKIILNNNEIEDYYLISNRAEDYDISINNTLTKSKVSEDVEEIRKNAPDWFKTGNRLITKKDYEYFFKNQMYGDIIDIKCMNNWEYISKFYSWLYQLGMEKHNDSQYYLNETYFNSYFDSNTHTLVDAADLNNVYIWVKSSNSEDNVVNILNDNYGIDNIKTLTTLTLLLKAINVYFDICAAPEEVAYDYFSSGEVDNFGMSDGENYDSYIEITLDESQSYINNSIYETVILKINDFFNINNCKFGLTVNIGDLTNLLYAINGILNIRTVYDPTVTEKTIGGIEYNSRAYDGLSFASWSSGFIDLGDDIQIDNTQRKLNDFQFPLLFNSSALKDKIKIIKKQLNNTNYIKF